VAGTLGLAIIPAGTSLPRTSTRGSLGGPAILFALAALVLPRRRGPSPASP
jgi:hypothetical protein